MTTGISNQNRLPTGNFNFSGVSAQNLAKNAKLIDSTLNLMNQALTATGKALEAADKMAKSVQQSPGFTAGAGGCFPTEKPNASEAIDRQASLKVDKETGKITTPGGYTIEQIGQFEWKVTGPDKKETRVWGDPHVEESDGGKWDFKKNSEFLLGDGTRICVTCKPYGNGATVTGELDIVNADSHVKVTDIDKGKGKVGDVTFDGDDALFKFNKNGADHITMGATTADWNFENREIIGSENQGEKLKTRDQAGTSVNTQKWQSAFASPSSATDMMKSIQDRFSVVQKMFESLKNTRAMGFNPFRKADDFFKYDRNQHLQGMQSSFKALSNMLQVLQRQFELSAMLRSRGSNIS
jgi:hypothetical protein